MKSYKIATAMFLPFMLGGCYECKDVRVETKTEYKTKTEYTTLFFSESWNENLKDTLLDGSIRTETSTFKDARGLTIRCFKATIKDYKPQLDLRYRIEIPLLKKIGKELEKAPTEMIVTVDGQAIGTVKSRAIAHDFGISFLGDVPMEIVDKLAAATKTIVVMPRQNGEKMDEAIEFGVGRLVDYIKPVKKACETVPEPQAPAPASQPTMVKTAPIKT